MLQISRSFTFKTLCKRNDTLLRSQLLQEREKQFIAAALNPTNECVATIDEIGEPEPWESIQQPSESIIAFNTSAPTENQRPGEEELITDQATTILLLSDDISNDSQTGNVEYTIEDNVEMEIMTMDIVDGGFGKCESPPVIGSMIYLFVTNSRSIFRG
jgi:hypothetical protein